VPNVRLTAIAGLLLKLSGVASLLIAPYAMSCTEGGDYRACETAGTIALNVVGVAQVAVGLIVTSIAAYQATR